MTKSLRERLAQNGALGHFQKYDLDPTEPLQDQLMLLIPLWQGFPDARQAVASMILRRPVTERDMQEDGLVREAFANPDHPDAISNIIAQMMVEAAVSEYPAKQID